MKWDEKSLIDFVWFQRGFDLPKSQFKGGDVPVYGSTSILGYHDTAKVKAPGIITGRSGTLGRFQFAKTDYWPHNTSLWVKDFKENDEIFAYYCLQSLDFSLFNSGGAVPTLNRNVLKSIRLKIPPLPIQKKIAGILSAYDDLIENNLKRIKLLEEAAQNIYEEWFVRMRFPGHETTAINNETGLPEGWERKKVGEVVEKLESGSRPKGGIDGNLKDGVPSIGAENVLGIGKYNYSKEKYVTDQFFEKMKKGKIGNKDILIYKDGAYIGKTSIFQDNFPHSKCAVNEHVFLLNTKNDVLQNYLYFMLSTKDYFDKMQGLNSNAAQPGINQKKLKSLEFFQPDIDLLKGFFDLSEPKVKLIFNFAKQNKLLKEARDILLSRLMSGMIDVENVEVA